MANSHGIQYLFEEPTRTVSVFMHGDYHDVAFPLPIRVADLLNLANLGPTAEVRNAEGYFLKPEDPLPEQGEPFWVSLPPGCGG